ncbi:thioredoxin domain-containing protein [Desnuesiella massiliensis]|uniref:thioredoxin domain-containing protein n=1 Tax=Desnuesiella massiliensis TaxID=1650662 RepID=UPI0006E408D5|nr:thioredoxin domain-containing protein [Desnuesiella massiliensis]
MTNSNRVPNHLVTEKSPYLLQHAYNPVDWYPWNEEAFEKAKKEDKPIFLSIGYSTCHWCHVMAHESFEDEEVALVLKTNFISIKVDREERPDIDSIYMSFCQAYTGSGGWPLTIIMTPEGKPFFAGTYIPKERKYNITGIIELLNQVVQMWHMEREKVISFSESFTAELQEKSIIEGSKNLSEDIIEQAVEDLKQNYDKVYGGFNHAPKFPTPHNLIFLMKAYKINKDKEILDIVEHTLDSMYRGGIFDHIGYGFSRYSVDEKWLVPHFEKMLYDNALLALAYTEAYEVTKKEIYKTIVENIFDYVSRELTSEEGGFYCGEDADSEGVEGKYYVWTPMEIFEALEGEAAKEFCDRYGITNRGNFEGKSIPNLIGKSIEISKKEEEKFETLRDKLLQKRNLRVHPHKDDKILVSWNGLMIAALAKAGRLLNEAKYLEAAQKAVDFILSNMIEESGRLYSRFREAEVANKGFLEDYAFLVWGLLEIYEVTSQKPYLDKALELNREMLRLFGDKEKGGFYLYGEDAEKLILRPKEIYDGAIPSGNSVATYNLLRLWHLSREEGLKKYAEQCFSLFGSEAQQAPTAHSMFLIAYLLYSNF